MVIDLDVPRDLVLSRIIARRVCQDCGTNYVATGSERSPWICDVCGGDVMQRDDDTPEAIIHRLDLYEEQTSPLIEFYDRTGRLKVVDGVDSPDSVFARMVAGRRRGDDVTAAGGGRPDGAALAGGAKRLDSRAAVSMAAAGAVAGGRDGGTGGTGGCGVGHMSRLRQRLVALTRAAAQDARRRAGRGRDARRYPHCGPCRRDHQDT